MKKIKREFVDHTKDTLMQCFALFDSNNGKIILMADYGPFKANSIKAAEIIPKTEWIKHGVKELKVKSLTKEESQELEKDFKRYKIKKGKLIKNSQKRRLK